MGLVSDNNYFKSIPKDAADILSAYDPNKPILSYTPPPLFRKEKEMNRYYDKERAKWVEGHNGIPGTLYFKTMECEIKNRLTGILERPVCRDVDLYTHLSIDKSKAAKHSAGVIKGRGVGFSTDGACIGTHAMCTNAGGRILLTSKDLGTISTIFNDKFLPTYEELAVNFRPEKLNINKTKNYSNLIVKTQYYDKNNVLKNGTMQIDARETSASDDAASGFSGAGAIFGFYDELPLHKRKEKLLSSSLELFRNHRTGDLDGFLLWGGTVEDTLSNDEIVQFRKTITDSKAWKSDIIFLEYGWGMNDPSKNLTYSAWTDWAFARAWWEKEYQSLLKEGNDVAIRGFMKNKPRSLDDVFDLASGGFWEKDVSEKSKKHYDFLVSQPSKVIRGNIKRSYNDVEFKANKRDGNVEILELPRKVSFGNPYDVNYFMGIDGASSDDETSVQKDKDRSRVAAVIMKMYESPDAYNFCPVLIYYQLPHIMEHCYEDLLACSLFYGAKTRIENNAGQGVAIKTYYTNSGFPRLLALEQLMAGTSLTKGNQSKFGKYKDGVETKDQKSFGNIYLRKYVESIQMESLMYDIAFANNVDNFDRLDAFLTCLSLCFGYIFVKESKEADVRKFIEQITMVSDGKGGLIWQVKKTSIANPHNNESSESKSPDSYTPNYLK